MLNRASLTSVCARLCASAVVWMSGMRHAWVACACVHALRGFVYSPPPHTHTHTPPLLTLLIQHHPTSITALGIICKTTQSCETKRGFWASMKRESGSDRTWPVPLDPSEGWGGDEVVTRWCVWVCVCVWRVWGGGGVSQGRDNPSSHGGPRVLGL